MAVRGFFVRLFVSAFVMALAWELMEKGMFQGQAETFGGKILISFFIILISNFLSKILGG